MGFKLIPHKTTIEDGDMFREKRCRKCGKEIYVTPGWVYKDSYGHYCSWKCFNHRFDGKDGKSIKTKKRVHKRIEQLDENFEVVRVFDNVYDAAAEVDGQINMIYDMCRFYRNGVKQKNKKYYWRYVDEPETKDENSSHDE